MPELFYIISQTHFPKDPIVAILSLLFKRKYGLKCMKLISLFLVAALGKIIMKWDGKKAPYERKWSERIFEVLIMAKLTNETNYTGDSHTGRLLSAQFNCRKSD